MSTAVNWRQKFIPLRDKKVLTNVFESIALLLKINNTGSEWMDRKGVTLVELVTVVMIITIAATLTLPNIGAWLSIYRLRTATRNIVSMMQSAKMMAVVRNAEYRVHFEAATGSYILQYRTAAGVWLDEGATQTLPQGIVFQEINLPSHNAEFNPDATSSSGNVRLRNRKEKEKKIVLFSATGRIRVEPPL